MGNLIVISLFIVIIVGGIALQIFLSKKDSKWFGLILPLLTFLYSLIIVFGLSAYSFISSSRIQTTDENDKTISEVNTDPSVNSRQGTDTIAFPAIVLVLYNIPTVILITIYAVCREKHKKNMALDKMLIQDLE